MKETLMRHKKIKEMLGAYFDGELSSRKKRIIEQHLKTCPECHRELLLFEKMDNLSQELRSSSQDDEYWKTFSYRVSTGIKQQMIPIPEKEAKMFKDSFIVGGKNYWLKALVFPVSLVTHVIIAALLIIMPMLNTGSLPEVEVYSAFLAPPPPPPPPPLEPVSDAGWQTSVLGVIITV